MKSSHLLDGGSGLAALLLVLPVVGCTVSSEPPESTVAESAALVAGGYQCVMSRAADHVRAFVAGSNGTLIVATGPDFRGQGVASLVQKLNTAEQPLWAWQAPQGDELLFNDLATDAGGNVFAVGRGLRTTQQPNGVEKILSWAFLLKFNPAGKLVFRHDYAKGGTFNRVVVTSAGAIVVLARVSSDEADVGGGPLPQNNGMAASVVARYNAAGGFLWSKYYDDTDAQAALDVAVDSKGDVIVAGRLASTFDFGGGPLTATPSPDPPGLDAFLVKYDASGNHRWSKRFGDDRLQNFDQVEVTSEDTVVAFGRNAGTIDFGGGSITGSSISSNVVAAFTEKGSYRWGSEVPDLSRLAIDASGAITLAGDFRDTVTLGTGPLVSAGEADVALSRLDGGGHPLASVRFGGPSDDALRGVTLAPQGSLFLIVHTEGAVNFGCATPATGPGDFIVALAPGGSP